MKRYNYDRFYFSNIDSEEKAYFLGWIASDGSVSENQITIAVHKRDASVIEMFIDNICPEFTPKIKKTNDMVNLNLCSKQMVDDVCRLLNINPGKKSNVVHFPNLPEELRSHFMRGVFDGDGSLSLNKRTIMCSITTDSPFLRSCIIKEGGCGAKENSNKVYWYGTNALHFLSSIYDNSEFYLPRKRNKYLDYLELYKMKKQSKFYAEVYK